MDVLAKAIRATQLRFGNDFEAKLEFTTNVYGPTDGTAKVYVGAHQYQIDLIERLMYKSNEDINFNQKFMDLKIAHSSMCSFFFGYVKAIEDAAEASKLAAEAPFKRELEMRSEFEYKRSSRY